MIINRKTLLDYFSIQDENRFRQEHRNSVKIELKNNTATRNPLWSESIAVGSELFITDIQQKLASRAQKRSVVSTNGTTVLKEPQTPYNTVFDDKKDVLNLRNVCFWQTIA